MKGRGNGLAGANSPHYVVLGPSLHGLDLVDDSTAVGIGHPPGPIEWDGLALLPYVVVPHHRSDHPGSEAIGRLVEHYTHHDLAHRPLRDGQVLLIDGDTETLLDRTPA